MRNPVHRASHDRCHVEAVASPRGRGARCHKDVANRRLKKDSKQPGECHLQVGLRCLAPCTGEGVGVDAAHHAHATGSQLDLVHAMGYVCDQLDALKDIRTEAAFSKLFTDATLLADLLGVVLTNPRTASRSVYTVAAGADGTG